MDALRKYEESIKFVVDQLPIKDGKFLITGATGLIGTCVIDVLLMSNQLKKTNFEIYALGRSEEKIKKRFGETVNCIIQDIIKELDDRYQFDYIINAASNADPRSYSVCPVETILTNVMGSRNVLEYCRKHKHTRLILTSSFEVYGKMVGKDIYKEEDYGIIDLDMLRNGYPESKRCSELLLRSYVEEYSVNAVIARLASVYGPTMQKNDSKAHAQFIRNAVCGKDIVLKSLGTQRRTYCYVIDAVSAIFKILFNGNTGEIYNVSNENSIATIAELAKKIAQIAGTKVIYEIPDEVESKGYSKVQNCILDNNKLKEMGWNGLYDLDVGLRETIHELCAQKKLQCVSEV